VVDLGQEDPAVALEAFDHPQLPERPVPVELDRHEPSHEVAELLLASGGWQGGVADVVAEVEVGIVDPHWPADLPGDEAHLLPVPREERELGGHQVDELLVGRWRPLENRARRDVHVSDAVLDVEEDAVERAQTVHRNLLGARP
jgi:hypothetical protein